MSQVRIEPVKPLEIVRGLVRQVKLQSVLHKARKFVMDMTLNSSTWM